MFNSKRLVALLLLWLWVCPSTAFAALSGSTIWEVETGGSDTLNGGAFDPSQTAGMNTDGAATSATGTAPVFTSASYNFVAGDVGAWIYIASGTNWTAGWYKISLVASNAATLNATIGQAVLKGNTSMSTANGCAATASPTGATWTIDYSQQSSAQFAYTDLASAGTGLTVSSVAHPFGKQQVGNSLVVTGGTNFNTGWFVLASIGALNVATVIGPTNITTGAGASGTGGLGGAFASPGGVAALPVSNTVFLQSGTYSITTASTNVSGGCWANNSATVVLVGYSTNRIYANTDTKPLMQIASGVSTTTLFAGGNGTTIVNIAADGNNQTSAKPSNAAAVFFRCSFTRFNVAAAGAMYLLCSATANSATAFVSSCFGCEAYSNTATPFAASLAVGCLSYNNTGGSTDGFTVGQRSMTANSVAVGNGRNGFGSTNNQSVVVNCIAEANAGMGYSQGALFNCGAYNNTGGATTNPGKYPFPTLIVPTGSFFVNAAATNFALNNLVNQGALARAAGILGAFPVAATTGYQDIGAAQSQCTGGSSTSSVGCGIIGQIQQEMRRRAIQEAAFAHNTRIERKWGFADKLPRPDLKWPLAIFGLAGWGGLAYIRLKK